MGFRLDAEADQDALEVGQVPDDLAQWRGEPAHERREGEDVVAAGQRRVLDQVDDLDLVLAGQMLLAQVLQVGEGTE